MVTVCPSQFATRRTLFHVLVGCGLLMLKVSRLKLPVIWLLVSDRKSGSAGMPRPISYAVFCLKKKKDHGETPQSADLKGDPNNRQTKPATSKRRERKL